MAHKHCSFCGEGMLRPTLRQALLDQKQMCGRCHEYTLVSIVEAYEIIVEDWEETHHFDGTWEQRNKGSD